MESGFYRDNSKKARAWADIGVNLGQSEHTCQTTWKNARAYYSKIKREKWKRSEELLEEGGSDAGSVSASASAAECYWVHFKAMDFLAPYVDDRGKARRRGDLGNGSATGPGSEDGDFLSAYCGLAAHDADAHAASAASMLGGHLLAAVAADNASKAASDADLALNLRSATSTPSSAAAASASEPPPGLGPAPAKRPRHDLLHNPAQPVLDFGRFDAYIEAIVTKVRNLLS